MTDATGSPEEIGGNDFMNPSLIDLDDFFPEAWLSSPPQKDQPEPADSFKAKQQWTTRMKAQFVRLRQEQQDAELARWVLMQERGLRPRSRKW
jgi:hypothetical protein